MTPALRAIAVAGGLTVASATASAAAPHEPVSIDTVQQLFYNGQYAEAAAASQTLPTDDEQLAVYELRTTALLFQLRHAIGEAEDKDKAFKACETCPALVQAFTREFEAGRTAARAVLQREPRDPVALFFLGKLDLNFVWLHLGTLGKRTGWNEYWEARHSLDAALALTPDFLRARVARAWIDYIVDTRMPWGTGWLLGGGNKKRALTVMRAAVEQRDDFYAHAEALFGLWDMQVREKNRVEALACARQLAALFPENPEVARYVALRSK